MKHATAESLDQIGALLDEIRTFEGLREKTRGVFYLKSRAFLHFHEDDGTLYADARLSGHDFDRFCLETSADQRRLVAAIRRHVIEPSKDPTSRSNRSDAKTRAPV
jgi:hypothetical protein